MSLSALSFRDLEYVVAVADNLHFGKAATACAVSQPTLSAQIRKLEDYLGLEIFERTNRAVLVTDTGAPIVAQARVILAAGRKLQELAQDAAEPLTGVYRLGIISTLGPYVTPLLLQPLRERYPQLTLLFTEGLTRHLVQALEAGELDAILASSANTDSDLAELPLFREDLVLAVPRDHPLAVLPQVHLTDLDPDEMILLNEGHCLREQVLALFPQPKRAHAWEYKQAAGVESLRQMVGAGLGYAIMPRLAVQVGALLDDMVAYRMIRDTAPQRSVSLFYRSSFARIRDTRLLRDLIRDTLQAAGTVSVYGRPSLVASDTTAN